MTQPQLGSFESIPLSLIRPSRTNPRKHFDDVAMQELTRSVQEMGVTQPILVRPIARYEVAETGFGWEVFRKSFGHGDDYQPGAPVDHFQRGGVVPGVDVGHDQAEKRAAELNAEDPAFELVSGERRYRAAKASGRTVVPAIIRALSDEEALEIQMIENLQRADLHPVEEAEGFRVLLHTGLDVEDIAKKAGKTVAHVQRIVKLLSLEVDAKQLFLEGHLTLGHALLLARLTPAEQERAIRYLLNGLGDWLKTPLPEVIRKKLANLDENWNKGKRLVDYTEAQLKTWIEQNVLLQLSTAPWHLADAQLLPIAGACTDCPKRTGANTALFADITDKDDVCMDPACFADKQAAQAKRQLAAAKESGTKLLKISAAASNARMQQKPVQQVKGSTEVVTNAKVKQGQWLPAKEGECNNTVQALIVDGPEKGSVRWVCADQDCKVHKHTVYDLGGSASRSSNAPKPETAAEKAARLEAEKRYEDREKAVRVAAFGTIFNAYRLDCIAILRAAIEEFENSAWDMDVQQVCRALDIADTDNEAEANKALEKHIEKARDEDTLFQIAFVLHHHELLIPPHEDSLRENRARLEKLAKENGVPKGLKATISEAEKLWDKEHAPQPEVKPAPAKSAAKKTAKKAGA